MGIFHQVRDSPTNHDETFSEDENAILTLFSGPGIVISLMLVIPAIPNPTYGLLDKDRLRRVDVIGGFLSLAWPILLVFALQEAGDLFPWRSGPVIGTLVGSAVGLLVFVLYEV